MLVLQIAVVQLLQVRCVTTPPPPPQTVSEFIAVPPKPEGANLTDGDGAGTTYTWDGCLKHTGDYRDACFVSLALQRSARDPNGALEACDQIAERANKWECHADVAELHSRVDRDWSEAHCPTIPVKKWRDQCYFGIALAWSVHDYDYARSMCEQSGQWKNFCRHDVNGEIAQVEPQNALDWCNTTPASALQLKKCYHGLGKYLGRTEPAVALDICMQVPDVEPNWREQCFHGIGWAIAETDMDQALTWCRANGDQWQDSCVLGISANAKRFDAERSVELCELVRDASLHEACKRYAIR